MAAVKPITNKHFKQNDALESAEWYWNYLMLTLPPGPAFIPQKYYTNMQKAGMPIACLTLMTYFDNWSTGCWCYFMLHGSYGTWWLLKG